MSSKTKRKILITLIVLVVLGGAGGAGAQVLTGKKKDLPAETELSFKTAQDLYLKPSHSSSGLQKRSASE